MVFNEIDVMQEGKNQRLSELNEMMVETEISSNSLWHRSRDNSKMKLSDAGKAMAYRRRACRMSRLLFSSISASLAPCGLIDSRISGFGFSPDAVVVCVSPPAMVISSSSSFSLRLEERFDDVGAEDLLTLHPPSTGKSRAVVPSLSPPVAWICSTHLSLLSRDLPSWGGISVYPMLSIIAVPNPEEVPAWIPPEMWPPSTNEAIRLQLGQFWFWNWWPKGHTRPNTGLFLQISQAIYSTLNPCRSLPFLRPQSLRRQPDTVLTASFLARGR